MEIFRTYFPDLESVQYDQFRALLPLYKSWNDRINVISRKDMEHFWMHHVLHSLGIAKVIRFKEGTKVLDVGTGGGFPGIPLAILFPQSEFLLVDSIGKKIRVVNEVANALELKNVRALQTRAETLSEKVDFVVSRAVTALPVFLDWVKQLIRPGKEQSLSNGILYLKGGDFEEELKQLAWPSQVFALSQWFDEPFFETKKVVHIGRP
ncbi:MAG: 16S rRNA (guanine(527)-N(7))-methyltransferase RsmG [Bacteroides sp.]|jgi:16S rRNA (guanine527-N7)-methyltransferase|nr:16S rRNA (guanine(527)-N(7))-methyltransferase RsmG [Bacteroides sp.]